MLNLKWVLFIYTPKNRPYLQKYYPLTQKLLLTISHKQIFKFNKKLHNIKITKAYQTLNKAPDIVQSSNRDHMFKEGHITTSKLIPKNIVN